MTDDPDPPPERPDLSGAVERLESFLLGTAPHLTKGDVAERADVPLHIAEELWRLMGFPPQTAEAVAFTEADVEALRLSHDLIRLGILGPDRQAALVRTWGRSFARLAEWQVELLRQVAQEAGSTSVEAFASLADEVTPRVEELQSYVWRRHLASAGSRVLVGDSPDSPDSSLSERAIVFVDIVGYTSRSKTMTERELVAWLEGFESQVLRLAVERDARIIKNIGDELLLVADSPDTALDLALELTDRGEDDEVDFPRVRAGVAFGDVVNRLGDVYGETVNVAARLTSVARPGTVLVDEGGYSAVTGHVRNPDADSDADDDPHAEGAEPGADTPYHFRRLRRLSVKGYPRLAAWRVRRRR